MTTVFLVAAAIMSALTFAAHVFIGGPKNAAPILSRPNLPLGPHTTMQFSWNAASLLLLSIALGFGVAAFRAQVDPLVWFLTLLCGFHAMLGIVVAARAGVSPLTFPPAMLFVAIAVLGGLAIASA